MSAAVAGPPSIRPTRSYTNPRDVTRSAHAETNGAIQPLRNPPDRQVQVGRRLDMKSDISHVSFERELLAHLVRTHHAYADSLENLYRPRHELGIGRKPPAREVQVVL
jgi:hypothetical protein